MDLKRFVKIGRPGYKGKLFQIVFNVCSQQNVAVTKQRDPDTGQHSLFFQVYTYILDEHTTQQTHTHTHSTHT